MSVSVEFQFSGWNRTLQRGILACRVKFQFAEWNYSCQGGIQVQTEKLISILELNFYLRVEIPFQRKWLLSAAIVIDAWFHYKEQLVFENQIGLPSRHRHYLLCFEKYMTIILVNSISHHSSHAGPTSVTKETVVSNRSVFSPILSDGFSLGWG